MNDFGVDLDDETFIEVSRDSANLLWRDRAAGIDKKWHRSLYTLASSTTVCLAYVSRFCYYCASLSRVFRMHVTSSFVFPMLACATSTLVRFPPKSRI